MGSWASMGAEYHELRGGLSNSRLVFERGGSGRVVFLGGSITNMKGWKEQVAADLQQRFPQTRFDFVNAGIPSTGSTPAAFRLIRDVFGRGPVDLLFEEAAVNDAANGRGDQEQIRAMEGLVRQALARNPAIDIVLMHFVDPEKMAAYRQGKIPRVIQNHERIADHYGLPSINLALEVTQRIDQGEFTWEGDFKDLHPSPFGHRLYSRAIARCFDAAWGAAPVKDKPTAHPLPRKLDPYCYELGKLSAPDVAGARKGFTRVPRWKNTVGGGTRPGFVDVPMLVGTRPGDGFELDFMGTAVGLFVAAGPDAGSIDYRVDGGPWMHQDLYTKWSGRLHIPWLYVLEAELAPGEMHTLAVRISNRKHGSSSGHACRIAHFAVNGHARERTDALPDDGVSGRPAEFWLSDPAGGIAFTRQPTGVEPGKRMAVPDIRMNPDITYQEMDGFGFALTGGSALHLHSMSAPARDALLTELFDHTGAHIGVSYLRISIGASDLDEKVFSYNDLPPGETDVGLTKFSLAEDRKHLIPMLREILRINPDLQLMASPWSPPLWMKTHGRSVGGSLLPEYYDAYARYLVRYIQEMAHEGITIDALTVQNEPLHPGNNPSMLMLAADQAAFIKNSLGPAFRAADIQTRIVIYDHNADRPDYPLDVLNDPQANPYIDGSAFHLYGGEINALSEVHRAHPDKNLYFTEQWIGAPGDFAADLRWHVRELIIGATRNWCRTVIEWNLAADENQKPHTPGGCTSCLGALTITGDSITRNPAYYIIAHASKFVRPGSRRIDSSAAPGLPNVAFQTSEDQVVIIVLNDSDKERSFNLVLGDATSHSTLPAGAVGTYVWGAREGP